MLFATASKTIQRLVILTSVALLAQQPRYELPAEQRTGSIKRIFVLPHSHLDIGFTLPPDQVARDYKDSIDLAIRLAHENEDFRWTIESAWMLGEWLKRTSDSSAIAELGKLLRERRIALGATFANMHSGLLDTEEMNRLVYLGEAFRRKFNIPVEVAYQNDVPGFSWAYPRVLAGSGVKYLLTGLNLFIGGGNNLGVANTPFYWVGPDGSKVLTWFAYDSYVEGYRWKLGSDASAEEMEQTVFRRLAWLERNGYPYDSYLVMDAVGDNGDPWVAYRTLQRIRDWNRRHPELPMKPCIAEEFFEDLVSKYGSRFKEVPGDAAGHWELVKLGAPEVSGRMREAAALLPAAESLATITWLLQGTSFPATDIADAWRELLTYHEHTAGAGPGWPGYFSRWQTDWNNAAHYSAAMSGYSNVRQLFDKAIQRLVGGTGLRDPARHPSESEVTVVVYNGLSWSRGGRVVVSGLPKELHQGELEAVDLVTRKTLPAQDVPGTDRIVEFFASTVPSTGYKLFRLRRNPGKPQTISAARSDVQVDPNGWIRSMRNIRTGTEMLGSSTPREFGRVFVSRKNGPYEAAVTGQPEIRTIDGPVATNIEISRRDGALRRTLVSTYSDAEYVDVAFSVHVSDSDGQGVRYAISLPIAGAKDTMAVDGPGMIVRIPVDLLPGGGAPQFTPLHFVHRSVGPKAGITLASRDAFLVRPDDLFLLASEHLTTKTREEGTQRLFRTEPRGSNLLEFHFRISVQDGDPVSWKRLGAENNLSLQATVISGGEIPVERSFVSVTPANVQVAAFKRSEFEPGWCVLRLQEIAGRSAQGVRITTPLRLTEPVVANIVEQRTGVAANLQDLQMQPWQTLTILAKCAP